MLHFKMIFRSWCRNSMSTVISLISLTTGLVCSVILILFVLNEHRVVDALGNTESIYLLETKNPFFTDKNVRSSSTYPYLALDLANKFGDVEAFATVKQADWKHDDAIREINWEKGVYAVTPQFVELFDIPVLEGDLKRTLSSASEIAVTNRYMQFIYGKNAVIGDRILARSGGNAWINGVQTKKYVHDVVITTILDENKRTPLSYGALVTMPVSELNELRIGSSNSYFSFIKLNAQQNIEDLQVKIKADSLHFRKNLVLYFTPFSDIYFDKSLHSGLFEGESFIVRRDPMILSIGLLVAFAILLIAAFNYVNITMTRARNRLKNIAGQRIFGATKWDVRWQTILDTALLVLISFVIALLFIYAIIPQFNSFMDSNIAIGDIFQGTHTLSIIALLMTLIFVPSLYILAKIEVSSPMETFKNPLGNNIKISSIMVVSQFVISVVLIAVSLNISRQMNYIIYNRPAFKSIVHLINSMEDVLPREFVDRVSSQASVESYTSCEPTPGSSVVSNGKSANYITGTNDLFDFYEMQLIEGRMFVEGENSRNVIVNESALRQFEIEQPYEGKAFYFNGDTLSIIAVVKDFMYEDAHKAIQPIIIEYDAGMNADQDQEYWSFYLKLNGDIPARIDEIQSVWKEMYPDKSALEIKTIAQLYADMHPQDQRLQRMVELFMYISILLTALGLFGLAFYTVERRTKEIAIRKIHGSTTSKVILLLCRTFAIWVGVAFAIAVPIAYYLSNEWLSTFVYRVPIVVWTFFATALIAALVTLLTVIFQTWRAASANPVRSIKGE